MALGAWQSQVSKKLDSKTIKQIGHEARKPLVSLICTADLLLTGLDGELSPQAQHDIERISSNARQALSKVDGLLELLKSGSEAKS